MVSHPSIWRQPPERLALNREDVHVWRARLNQPASTVKFFRSILSPDELRRADSFYFQKDRAGFIVARAVLRTIISRYLGVSPIAVRFCYGRHGKPALAEESGEKGLRFNISHSHELALYVVACDREVGIDLEYIRRDFASQEIARHFFSPREVSTLCALPASVQTEAFFNCWTRKEAYIKATGQGLALPLHQFDVSLSPGEPAALLGSREHPQESSRWTLLELAPGEGYVAALAVEGHDWRINRWQF
jgi:4'-phosphopantetheinyl transferase